MQVQEAFLCGKALLIRQQNWDNMLEHILSCLPEEGCGVLGGRDGQVDLVIPVTNHLHSPVRFRMAPEEQLKAFLQIEDLGYDLVAFYHSHPAGPQTPSETDLAEFAYPGVLSIIWSPVQAVWKARAFCLDGGKAYEVSLVILPDSTGVEPRNGLGTTGL